jgi:hypothetical protein
VQRRVGQFRPRCTGEGVGVDAGDLFVQPEVFGQREGVWVGLCNVAE